MRRGNNPYAIDFLVIFKFYDLREKIEEFKSKMPVIRTLGNPGFRDRHWENVSNIVGFPVKGGSNLFQILDMGLDEYVSKFEKIR